MPMVVSRICQVEKTEIIIKVNLRSIVMLILNDAVVKSFQGKLSFAKETFVCYNLLCFEAATFSSLS